MKRAFIYSDEKSDKFWIIEINGNRYTVNFGKAGTSGQTQIKEFTNETACQKAAEKLVTEKTKKGYVETDDLAIPEKKDDPKQKKHYDTYVMAAWNEEDKNNTEKYIPVFNVDIDDVDSVIAVIEAIAEKLDDKEFLDKIKVRCPPIGTVKDELFYKIENPSEPRNPFYPIAAEYTKARPALRKLCERIIGLNKSNSGCPHWETDEEMFGSRPAFALAMVEKKYVKTAMEMMTSMRNGDHSVPSERIAEMMSKWSVCKETLEFFAELWNMPLQDLDADVESIIENICIEDMIEDEDLFSFFLKKLGKSIYQNRDEFKNDEDLDEDEFDEVLEEYIEWYLETLFSHIFPDEDIMELGKKFLKLVLEKKTPTYELLTEE